MAEGNAGSRYVFCDENGGPIRQSNFRRDVWIPILVTAGLAPVSVLKMRGRKKPGEPRRVLPKIPHHHDLRHTFATLHEAAGTSMHVMKEVLGHSTVMMTIDRYTHRDESQHRLVADRTEWILRGQEDDLRSNDAVTPVYNAS